MRLKLTISTCDKCPELTLNNQYPLSADIHNIAHRAAENCTLFFAGTGLQALLLYIQIKKFRNLRNRENWRRVKGCGRIIRLE